MQVPPEIVAKNVNITPEIDRLITRGIAKLEKVCNYIISTRIAVEREQGRHQKGNPYRMRIDVRIPDRSDVIVQRSSKPSLKIQKEPAQSGPLPVTGDEIDKSDSQFLLTSVTEDKRKREEILPALIRRTFESARRAVSPN